MNGKDLANRRFGLLIAKERTGQKDSDGKCYLWRCQCDCGKEILVGTSRLTSKNVRSCGCLQDESRRKGVVGERVGQLTAIERAGVDPKGRSLWRYQCKCGAVIVCPRIDKTSGRTMCPDCARKLKIEQARAMENKVERADGTNVTALRAKLAKPDMSSANSSGFRGVHWHKGVRKWVATIGFQGKCIRLGYFADLMEAVQARKEAERHYYAEYLQEYDSAKQRGKK